MSGENRGGIVPPATRVAESVPPSGARLSAFLVAAGVLAGAEACFGQSASSEVIADPARERTDFHIPAMPLARALMVFGEVTGLEVFYKASLAEGRQAAAVEGSLTPTAALQMLLRGTGYAARTTGRGAFTIVPIQPEGDGPSAATAARRGYEPFFAAIQARVSETLCRSADGTIDHSDVLLRFWLSPSGAIERAEVIDEGGTQARDQTLATILLGTAIGIPPDGMPQPINMVIFRKSQGTSACRLLGAQRRAR